MPVHVVHPGQEPRPSLPVRHPLRRLEPLGPEPPALHRHTTHWHHLRPESRRRRQHTERPHRAQAEGIDAATAQAWREELAHPDEPEPTGKPYVAALDAHGWELVWPDEAGKTAHVFSTPPAVGDFVKVLVAFKASDAKGEVVTLTAGWWLEVEDVSGATWRGVLDNYPKVPSTLVLGSRVWFTPRHVIDWHAKAAPP